jgi:hypothetical protein
VPVNAVENKFFLWLMEISASLGASDSSLAQQHD